jgi:hypothetical protein
MEWVADFELGNVGLELLNKLVINAILHEDTRAGTAALAMVEAMKDIS